MRISQLFGLLQFQGKVSMSLQYVMNGSGEGALWFVRPWDSHAAVEHTFEAIIYVVMHLKCEVDDNMSCLTLYICCGI